MPSSTSSFERRLPAGAWSRTWVVAAAIAIVAVAWLEHASRAHGQRPSVVDDPVRWSLARRAVDGDRNVVAFVGTSRLELAYSAEAFAAAAPKLRGVQLAINGVPAIGVLPDLAADPDFHGVAVVDLDEWDIAWGDFQGLAAPYVKRSHALWRAPGALANRLLAGLVQAQLAVLAVGGRAFIRGLTRLSWPPATWVATATDRTGHGDYTVAEPRALRAKAEWRYGNFTHPFPTADEWLALAHQMEPLVAQIRAHGGDVVFVHLPISGGLAAKFDEHYPRAQYWDRFAAQTAAHVIHFRDVPALAQLPCADEMHLDQQYQGTFARGLVDAMRASGALAGRE